MKRAYWDLKYLKQLKENHQTQLKRVSHLPQDHQQAFQEISDYLTTSYGGFDGLDLMEAQHQLIDLLEEAAFQGLSAKAVVGEEITVFAKEFGQATEVPNWSDRFLAKRQQKINHRIQKKIGGK